MKKTVLTILLSLIAITASAFADDCNLVSTGNLGIEKLYGSFAYKNVVPKEAMQQAFTNLKAYCCKNNIPQNPVCKAEKDKLPTNYPESAYFFDHVLDVTMRRLDGVQSLAYGLEPDPAGKQRREYITQVANNPIGEQAMTLEKTYTEYRTLHEDETKDLNIVVANYNGKNNSATLSLEDKYNTVCILMKNIYENIQNNLTIIGGKFENNSFFNICENRVQDRVKRENAYVKMLMIQKSNQLFDTTTKAYTQKHFVEEKLMGLWDLIAKVKDTFKTIVQQAAASKTCSK